MRTAHSNPTRAKPLLLHVFSTFAVGGPQIRFAQIANALGPRYRHKIISMDGRYEAQTLLGGHVDVGIETPCDGSLSFGRRVAAYRRTLREIRPDTLITYNWGAIEWAIANLDGNFRHVHIEDGFGPEEVDRQLQRRIWTRRMALRRHSRVIVPSLGLYDIALSQWRIARDRLFHVPNGVDWQKFLQPAEQTLVDYVKWPPDHIVIGTVAALRAEKNLGRLLKAFRLIVSKHPCHLVIVGDGKQRQSLEDITRNLSISDQVTFTGHMDEPEKILGAFDIFGLSSDTEQMPYSVLEAMANALPIAAVDVGDVKAMVTDENKPFIVSRNIEELGAALNQLASDRTLRERIGQANRLKVKSSYSIESMIESYEMLFCSEYAGAILSSKIADATNL